MNDNHNISTSNSQSKQILVIVPYLGDEELLILQRLGQGTIITSEHPENVPVGWTLHWNRFGTPLPDPGANFDTLYWLPILTVPDAPFYEKFLSEHSCSNKQIRYGNDFIAWKPSVRRSNWKRNLIRFLSYQVFRIAVKLYPLAIVGLFFCRFFLSCIGRGSFHGIWGDTKHVWEQMRSWQPFDKVGMPKDPIREMLKTFLWFSIAYLRDNGRSWKNPPEPKSVKRILVISTDYVGDFVIRTSLLKRLREGYPQAHIDLMVGDTGRNICVLGKMYFDQIIDIPFLHWRSHRTRITPGAPDFTGTEKTINKLCHNNYDIIISSVNGWALLDAMLSRLGAKWSITEHTTHTLSYKLHHPPHDLTLWMPERMARFADACLPPNENYTTSIRIPEDATQYAQERMVSLPRFRIAIHPSSPDPTRRWPVPRWQQLIRFLENHYDAGVVILDTKNPAWKTFAEERNETRIVSGKIDIIQAGAMLSKCQYFIGHDSGFGHLAGALKIPGIVLFSSGCFTRWRPAGPIKCIKTTQTCAPCNQSRCPNSFNCLDEISYNYLRDFVSNDLFKPQ